MILLLRALLVLLPLFAQACTSLGSVTGAAAGITSSLISSNPAVGVAVGVGVRAGTDALVAKVVRTMKRTDQDRLAMVAGSMHTGDQSAWESHHIFHIRNTHGRLQVVREIQTPIVLCKEVLFSVSERDAPRTIDPWYITQICQREDGTWKWAAAEPAVERWGNLQ